MKFIVPLLIFLLILRKPSPGQPFIQAVNPDPKLRLSGFYVFPEHTLIDKRCLSRQKICSQSQLRFYCSSQHGSCQHCHNSGFLHLFPYSVFHGSSSFLPDLAFLIHMFFLQELTFPQTKASLPGKWCMINIFFDKIKWISASKRCVNRSRRMQDQDFFNVSHFQTMRNRI